MDARVRSNVGADGRLTCAALRRYPRRAPHGAAARRRRTAPPHGAAARTFVLPAASHLLLARVTRTIGARGPEVQTPAGDAFTPFRVGLDHIALACADESELERVTAALTDAGVDNTGIKLDPALGKRYVAFKDPDRIAWELYMV